MAARADMVPGVGLALDVVSAVVKTLRTAAGAPAPDADRLSLTEFRLLKRLSDQRCLARDLAVELDVTPATISAAVDGLVRRGLVRRDEPEGDRRAVPLSATPAGAAALEAARARQLEAMAGVLEGLTARERRALLIALQGLDRVLHPVRTG